jgi:uncharacterized membrane protein YqgA involved in biofilm formation
MNRGFYMTGLGTIVNVAAIIVGGIAGTLITSGLGKKYKDIIMQAIGLSVIVVGVSGALQGIFLVAESKELDRRYITVMIVSLVIGGIVGELTGIEDKLDKLGNWFQKRFSKGSGSFSEGFVTASLVFCVGAMAIVGSLEDGLLQDRSTLFAKSVLDGVAALIFASSLGIGVAFSALPVLLYQGTITIMAGYLRPWLTGAVISQISVVGGVLILAIGMNLLQIVKIKVGNLLPAVFIPVVYEIIRGAVVLII